MRISLKNGMMSGRSVSWPQMKKMPRKMIACVMRAEAGSIKSRLLQFIISAIIRGYLRVKFKSLGRHFPAWADQARFVFWGGCR